MGGALKKSTKIILIASGTVILVSVILIVIFAYISKASPNTPEPGQPNLKLPPKPTNVKAELVNVPGKGKAIYITWEAPETYNITITTSTPTLPSRPGEGTTPQQTPKTYDYHFEVTINKTSLFNGKPQIVDGIVPRDQEGAFKIGKNRFRYQHFITYSDREQSYGVTTIASGQIAGLYDRPNSIPVYTSYKPTNQSDDDLARNLAQKYSQACSDLNELYKPSNRSKYWYDVSKAEARIQAFIGGSGTAITPSELTEDGIKLYYQLQNEVADANANLNELSGRGWDDAHSFPSIAMCGPRQVNITTFGKMKEELAILSKSAPGAGPSAGVVTGGSDCTQSNLLEKISCDIVTGILNFLAQSFDFALNLVKDWSGISDSPATTPTTSPIPTPSTAPSTTP